MLNAVLFLERINNDPMLKEGLTRAEVRTPAELENIATSIGISFTFEDFQLISRLSESIWKAYQSS